LGGDGVSSATTFANTFEQEEAAVTNGQTLREGTTTAFKKVGSP
jgi:hypothetical protein